MKKNTTLILSIVIAAVVIGGAIIYATKKSDLVTPQNNLSEQGLSIEGLQLKGDPKAPATIVEFGDFQCSYCAEFFVTTEPQIRSKFVDAGKASMAFKVLAFIGKESIDAGNAVECAADQGKFWEMHDAIYSAEAVELSQKKNNENTGNLNRGFFASQAENLKMDKAAFLSCYDSQKYTSKLDGFMSDARKAMSNRVGTPAVFIIKDGVTAQLNKTQRGPFDINEYDRIIGK